MSPAMQSEGITFEDVEAISALIQNIQDVETALSMHMAAGASITASECVEGDGMWSVMVCVG